MVEESPPCHDAPPTHRNNHPNESYTTFDLTSVTFPHENGVVTGVAAIATEAATHRTISRRVFGGIRSGIGTFLSSTNFDVLSHVNQMTDSGEVHAFDGGYHHLHHRPLLDGFNARCHF
jgi:hypothetical protein